MPKQAQISTEILSLLLLYPGIRHTLMIELEENEFHSPLRYDRLLNSEREFITMVRNNIDKLLIEPIDISQASTTSINSINSSSCSGELNSTATNDLTKMINNLIKHFVNHKTSLQELEQMARLLNSMPGASVVLPTTRYLLMKEMQSRCMYDCVTYIFCRKCSVYSKKPFFSPDECPCKRCSSQIKSRDNNLFIYIYVEAQLRSILLQNWKSVNQYLETVREKNNRKIEDVYDGKVLKKIMKNNDFVLSLTVNTDGVSYEKSNIKSVWHLQLICNFLPPEIRFNLRNIILCGIFYGEEKPNLQQYFEPLGEEMQSLQTSGLSINDINFKVFVTHGTFDLPAKAQAQNTMQYNGYNGCGYCHHHGVAFGKTVKFPNEENSSKPRSQEEMVSAMEKIHRSRKSICIDGVKGISPMIAFDGFDLVHSFGVDYMHNSLLGNLPALISLWLSPKNRMKLYYISKRGREELDRRISSLKLCVFFRRKPRSMLYRHQFKASEYRAMLLYYFGVCLDGILPEKYLRHFRLLSSAIYTLLCTSISLEEKQDAARKIEKFVKLFQEYYGEDKMTMNIHMLKHSIVENFDTRSTELRSV